MLPNFIIVGAHKAGTTSLAGWLRSHPDVFFPWLKEPRFFAYDSSNSAFTGKAKHVFPVRTLKEYESLFDKAQGFRAIGEASPQYLSSEFACDSISRMIPDARIIINLRHPVTRAYSQYWMRVRLGRENRPFQEAIFSNEDWVNNSFYYINVRRYLERFGYALVLPIVFEKLISVTAAELERVSSFLDIDSSAIPKLLPRENVGRISSIKALSRIGEDRRVILACRALMPRILRKFLKAFFSKGVPETPKLTTDEIELFSHRFREDIARTSDLLRVDLAEFWRPI